jgi:hypothetical protein
LIIALNFFVNYLMSSSMNLLWTIINTLQIVVYLPLVHLNFPQNAYTLSMFLMKVVCFDAFPHEEISKYFLKFDRKHKKVESRVKKLGFETNNFILNAGTLFYVYLMWVSLVILYMCFNWISSYGLVKLERFKKWLGT